MQAVTDGKAADRSGVPHADLLVAFAEAALASDPGALEGARAALHAELGDEALVDTAAVVGNFQRMVRIADSTGIPLDAPVHALSAEVRDELDLGRFASSANTPDPGGLQRTLGNALRPAAMSAFRWIGRLRRASGRG